MAANLARRAIRPTINALNNSFIHKRGYAAPAGGPMSFTFASPSEVFYNKASVKQVDVPSYSGSFGILPNHVPCLAMLKPGVLTVYEDSASKKYFVSSGSITINDDSSVQVLAQEAVPVERLDPQACREGLSKAQQELGSAATERARAEAQIAVEVHEELIRATS